MDSVSQIPDGYKRCSKCGEVKPLSEFCKDTRASDGLRCQCRGCASDYGRQYRVTHRDKARESSRKYHAANIDKVHERKKQYRAENLDKKREKDKQYRAKNPERNRQYRSDNADKERKRHKQYYADNADKICDYGRQYRAKNPEYQRQWHAAHLDKSRIYDHRRRARKRAAEGTHTVEELKIIWRIQDGKCLYCKRELDFSANPLDDHKAHLDHFVPLAYDGRNSKENLAWSCRVCNESKKARLPWNWPGWNGAYPVFWDGRLL